MEAWAGLSARRPAYRRARTRGPAKLVQPFLRIAVSYRGAHGAEYPSIRRVRSREKATSGVDAHRRTRRANQNPNIFAVISHWSSPPPRRIDASNAMQATAPFANRIAASPLALNNPAAKSLTSGACPTQAIASTCCSLVHLIKASRSDPGSRRRARRASACHVLAQRRSRRFADSGPTGWWRRLRVQAPYGRGALPRW